MKPDFYIEGPLWKSENQYLTQEGYPLGTTCWFFTCEVHGSIKKCCGETQGEAFAIAIKWLGESGVKVASGPTRNGGWELSVSVDPYPYSQNADPAP